MTQGVIASIPPLIQQPPGSASANPAGLPGVTYTAAIPILPQTWTGLQTFEPGSVQFAGLTSGNTFLNASAIASGTVQLPAITGTDTLLANNNTATVTNKSLDGLANTFTNLPAASLIGTLPALSLPNPSATTLGGIESAAAVSHQWINSISTSGVPALSQPAFADISGSVAATQLPNPSATTLGGVESLAAGASKWINTISTSGVPSATQPAFTDVSGSVAATQMPALTGDVTTSAGAVVTTIASNAVSNAKFRQGAALSIVGVTGNATANVADIVGTANQVARVNGAGTALAFGAIDISQAAAATGILQTASHPALTGDVTTPSGSIATTIAANAVTNAKMATMAAWTLKANNTSGAATPTDITIDGLTLKASPAAGDEVIIWDVAGAALKKATVSGVGSSAGVSSIAGNTGAFTLSTGITNSTNDIRLVVPVTAPNGGTGVVSPATHTIPINQGASAQANTGTGTIGQALVSGGASADPSYKSGVPVLLNTLTASTSATLSDTTSFTSTYNEYEIVFENIVPSAAATFELQVHSGGSFQTTGYIASAFFSNGASTANSAPTTFIQLNGSIGSTTIGLSGTIRVYQTSNTAQPKQWTGQTSQFNGTSSTYITMIGGFWNSTAAIDGFQVLMSTGTMTSGTIKIYGIL
jgi:hypothetical protein